MHEERHDDRRAEQPAAAQHADLSVEDLDVPEEDENAVKGGLVPVTEQNLAGYGAVQVQYTAQKGH